MGATELNGGGTTGPPAGDGHESDKMVNCIVVVRFSSAENYCAMKQRPLPLGNEQLNPT